MSEEKNIPGKKFESENQKIESVNEHYPEDSHTPQPATLNIQPATSSMETHAQHLHHAPGKKFWHYFYEFLMLFLAVFCGFLAENFREHQVEKERGEEYIHSLYEDLKTDTMRLTLIIKADNEKIAVLNDMAACYDRVSKNLKETSCMGELVKYSKVNKSI